MDALTCLVEHAMTCAAFYTVCHKHIRTRAYHSFLLRLGPPTRAAVLQHLSVNHVCTFTDTIENGPAQLQNTLSSASIFNSKQPVVHTSACHQQSHMLIAFARTTLTGCHMWLTYARGAANQLFWSAAQAKEEKQRYAVLMCL